MQIESGAQTAQDKWITHVLRAHRTLHEMLKDRSYVVSDDKMDMTRDQMKSKLGFNNITREDGTATTKVAVDPCQHLNNIYKRAEQGDNADVEDPELKDQICLDEYSVVVFWSCDQDKLTTDDLKSAQLTAMKAGVQRVIIIVKATSSLARKGDKELEAVQYEIFTLDDLQVNITKHMLVPPHSVLSQDAKQDLLTKYRIQEHQLPKILHADPIARYFGVTKGEVMKIVRPSQTAGRYVTYRIVI